MGRGRVGGCRLSALRGVLLGSWCYVYAHGKSDASVFEQGSVSFSVDRKKTPDGAGYAPCRLAELELVNLKVQADLAFTFEDYATPDFFKLFVGRLANKVQEWLDVNNVEVVRVRGGVGILWVKDGSDWHKAGNIDTVRTLLSRLTNSFRESTSDALGVKLKVSSKRRMLYFHLGSDPSVVATACKKDSSKTKGMAGASSKDAGKKRATGRPTRKEAEDMEGGESDDHAGDLSDEEDVHAQAFFDFKGNAASVAERLENIGCIKVDCAKIAGLAFLVQPQPIGICLEYWHILAAKWEVASASERTSLVKLINTVPVLRLKLAGKSGGGGSSFSSGANSEPPPPPVLYFSTACCSNFHHK